jgi:hypothetical protein
VPGTQRDIEVVMARSPAYSASAAVRQLATIVVDEQSASAGGP